MHYIILQSHIRHTKGINLFYNLWLPPQVTRVPSASMVTRARRACGARRACPGSRARGASPACPGWTARGAPRAYPAATAPMALPASTASQAHQGLADHRVSLYGLAWVTGVFVHNLIRLDFVNLW